MAVVVVVVALMVGVADFPRNSALRSGRERTWSVGNVNADLCARFLVGSAAPEVASGCGASDAVGHPS